MDQPEYIKTTDYGNSQKQESDCILTCIHGSTGRAFLDNYPEIFNIIEIRKEVFMKYLEIERDIGSTELAHKIAKHLSEVSNNYLKIEVIEVLIPRGIVDPNRITHKCIRNIFDHQNNAHLIKEFKKIHKVNLGFVLDRINALHKNSCCIDIHTMAPYDPVAKNKNSFIPVIETKDILEDYIDAYTNTSRRGKRRDIDIVTQLENNEIIANEKLAAFIANGFSDQEINFKFNIPYPYASFIMAYHFAKLKPGVQIDIPKDFLCNITAEHKSFNLSKLDLDNRKISNIAKIIADAARIFINEQNRALVYDE